ncbi:ATP-dependent Clp protease adaptor ClpS [Hungatella hathewayi]|jgi:ATP-dependent Clp protease adaptor protein ClpS|uniref:ATP-dependent Clp protease adapter protein ClpS n=2 Tax=Hungatella hathewayi TaxID=154046 RepID=D3AB39_9FIRM|nr:ATP-dependent Clp protease adaptor protein ClpS [Hungatella hathewayi DSM 13479]
MKFSDPDQEGRYSMPANTGLSEKTEIRLKQPKQYKVVMYNDDFTPMDVVVEILIDVFRKNYEEAVAIMMTVHKGQRAVVGVYSYDIAMTKAARAVKIAREQGYPFRVEVES